MTKHTPGPWRAQGLTRSSAILNINLATEDGDCVAFLGQIDGNRHAAALEANARLIAAAPAMYDELKCLVDDAAEAANPNARLPGYERIVKLLAKAEGRPQ